MPPSDLQAHYDRLGVSAEVSAEDLERAWARRSFAATQARDEAQKAALREAYTLLLPIVAARERSGAHQVVTSRRQRIDAVELNPPVPGQTDPTPAPGRRWDPWSRESRWINALALPVFFLLAAAINHSPLAFFLRAFKIWIHEFGHATVGWLGGYKALPLPLGWTTYSDERVPFVYWGVLFLLGVFFWTGWTERRVWPLLLAPILAALQAWMTWGWADWEVEKWRAWAGVGGEFYLSALMVAAFFIDLPEAFRWGGCRWVFLFLGAAGFLDTFGFWQDVARGVEDIPWGTMMHGAGDEGGDMNQLHDGWGWSRQRIIASYTGLGQACLIGMIGVYLFFNLRLNRIGPWILDRVFDGDSDETA